MLQEWDIPFLIQDQINSLQSFFSKIILGDRTRQDAKVNDYGIRLTLIGSRWSMKKIKEIDEDFIYCKKNNRRKSEKSAEDLELGKD